VNTLYDKIDAASKFTAPPEVGIPIKDQAPAAAFGLEWAARQQPQPAPVETPKMAAIIPVAN
jgi:hypothetical protein